MSVVSASRKSGIAALSGVLPKGAVLTRQEDLARYSRDWSGDHYGLPLAVARPSSVDEVSALLRHCRDAHIPVVPQGGLTGLVGAAVAAPGGGEVVILSLIHI